MNNIERKMNSTIEKQWYTITEVASYLGLTEPAVRARLQRKEIPYERLGKRVLIKKDVLESLVGGQYDE
jgi:excisionase family DNA binding protein|tara:strand:- start:1566 stop:1772 length:207 start_codon:yes stop_codon:yes gene_type:complete